MNRSVRGCLRVRVFGSVPPSFSSSLSQMQYVTVVTHAHLVREIQTITTTASTGNTLGGTFSLQFDTSATGGSLQYSGELFADAVAYGSRYSVQSVLEAMSNIGEGCIQNVTRSAADAESGYTWSITFAPRMDNVPELVLHESALTPRNGSVLMTPATVVDGNEIGGTFRLTFDGYNATDSEMENALETLSTITSVDLECGAVDNKLVLIYSDTPTYSSASSMANVTLDDGNELSGRFKLEYDGMGPTGWIDYDASASEATSALKQLGTIPSVVRLR